MPLLPVRDGPTERHARRPRHHPAHLARRPAEARRGPAAGRGDDHRVGRRPARRVAAVVANSPASCSSSPLTSVTVITALTSAAGSGSASTTTMVLMVAGAHSPRAPAPRPPDCSSPPWPRRARPDARRRSPRPPRALRPRAGEQSDLGAGTRSARAHRPRSSAAGSVHGSSSLRTCRFTIARARQVRRRAPPRTEHAERRWPRHAPPPRARPHRQPSIIGRASERRPAGPPGSWCRAPGTRAPPRTPSLRMFWARATSSSAGATPSA